MAAIATSTRIPRWPSAAAQLRENGTATLTINGGDQQLAGGSVDRVRELVLEQVTQFAAEQLQRPVRLTTADPDGREWKLAVHPDGHVEELLETPSATLRGRRGDTDSSRPGLRRIVARIAVLGVLALVAGTSTFLVIRSRDASPAASAHHASAPRPRPPTPASNAPPLRSTTTAAVKPVAVKLRRARAQLALQRRRSDRLTLKLRHTESQRAAWQQWAHVFSPKRYAKLKRAAKRQAATAPHN